MPRTSRRPLRNVPEVGDWCLVRACSPSALYELYSTRIRELLLDSAVFGSQSRTPQSGIAARRQCTSLDCVSLAGISATDTPSSLQHIIASSVCPFRAKSRESKKSGARTSDRDHPSTRQVGSKERDQDTCKELFIHVLVDTHTSPWLHPISATSSVSMPVSELDTRQEGLPDYTDRTVCGSQEERSTVPKRLTWRCVRVLLLACFSTCLLSNPADFPCFLTTRPLSRPLSNVWASTLTKKFTLAFHMLTSLSSLR